MKRKLLWANLALVALAAAGAMHLRREWIDARAQEAAFLHQPIRPLPAPPYYPLPGLETVKASDYSDIAQKMLFSKDRNPVVVVAPPPPPKPVPMPPLPLFHGVLNLGDGPIAIMSLGPKGPHRDYQAGDQVGPFKLVAVNNDELVLEWQGQTIKKKVDEFLDHETAAPSSPAPAQPASAAPLTLQSKTVAAEPGGDLGGGIRACVPGDNAPAGTVANGMRKVLKVTPFGSRCYWEADK